MRPLLSILLLLLACPPCRATLLAQPIGTASIRRHVEPAATGLVSWDVPAPKDHAINLVFVSEAYAADSLSSFPLDAQRAWLVVAGLAPINRHLDRINRWLYIAESRDNGADKPAGPVRDTVYGSYYGDRGVRRLIGCDLDAHYRLSIAVADEVPRPVFVMVVNDAEYGGSGGSPVIGSVASASGWIVAHELMHRLFGLGDEYRVSSGALPFAYPNVALSTNSAPWLGGAGAGLIRIEEGRYKPFAKCLMNSLDVHALDPWCEHVVEEKILQLTQ